MVVLLSVLTMLLLLPLTLGFMQMGSVEAHIGRNHYTGAQARALAESATEMALHQIRAGGPLFGAGDLGAGVWNFTAVEIEPGVRFQVDGRGCVPTCTPGSARRRVVLQIVRDPATEVWTTQNYQEVPEP